MKSMKNYMKGVVVGFAGFLLLACSSNEANVISSDDPVEIRLKGALGAISASTRGEGPIGGDYEDDDNYLVDGELEFTMFRADAEYQSSGATPLYQFSGEWSAIGNEPAVLSGGMITLNPRQYYNIHLGNTRMIGVYPSIDNLPSPLSVNFPFDGSSIYYAGFDGTVDIMTTQMIEGNRVNSMIGGQSEGMIFSHLLSQVTVNLYGIESGGNTGVALAHELEQINEKWGITEIRVKDGLNPEGEIIVQLPEANAIEYGWVREYDGTHPWESTLWGFSEALGSRATISSGIYYDGAVEDGCYTPLTMENGFTLGWRDEPDLNANRYGSALVLPKLEGGYSPSQLTLLLCCNGRWLEAQTSITNWEAGKSYVVNIGVSITAIEEISGQIVKWIKVEPADEVMIDGFDE